MELLTKPLRGLRKFHGRWLCLAHLGIEQGWWYILLPSNVFHHRCFVFVRTIKISNFPPLFLLLAPESTCSKVSQAQNYLQAALLHWNCCIMQTVTRSTHEWVELALTKAASSYVSSVKHAHEQPSTSIPQTSFAGPGPACSRTCFMPLLLSTEWAKHKGKVKVDSEQARTWAADAASLTGNPRYECEHRVVGIQDRWRISSSSLARMLFGDQKYGIEVNC